MTFFKTVSMSGVATVAKILTGLVSTKILAVLIGPSGVALIGQINNLIAIVLPIGSGGINTGVVKYLAESESAESTKIYIKQAVLITLICSLTCSILLLVFSRYLSLKLLETAEYTYVFLFLALFFVLMALNGIFLSILNGLKQINKLILTQVISSIVSLVVTVLLVYIYNIKGVLIANIISQSIICFVSFWYCWKSRVFVDIFSNFNIDKGILKKYGKYTIMTLTSAFTVPLGQLFLRNYVIDKLGLQEAGILQGMWTISGVYLMVMTTALATYYLPKLSSLQNRMEVCCEVKKTLKTIIVLAVIMFSTIYFARGIIVLILFTKEFAEMKELFAWQLIGDLLRTASFVFGYIIIAKTLMKQMFISEIVFTVIYLLLAVVAINYFAVRGVVIAYSAMYLFHLCYTYYVFNRWSSGKIQRGV